MRAYAIAHLHHVVMGPAIVEYLKRIDATLEPFGGRYIVHGGDRDVLEGSWSGDLIVIEFPDRDRARSWYASPAYREIVRLRTDHSEGSVIIIHGVPEAHRAVDIRNEHAAGPVEAQA